MDSTHMMMTCLKMKEHGLHFAAVHDSYWTHPGDIPIMSKVHLLLVLLLPEALACANGQMLCSTPA
jgi:DNA-directed RNA polymerase